MLIGTVHLFIKYLQDNYKDKIEVYVELVLNKKDKEILKFSEDNIYGFKCFNTEILDYKFTKS